jgi:hypothetical protein
MGVAVLEEGRILKIETEIYIETIIATSNVLLTMH